VTLVAGLTSVSKLVSQEVAGSVKAMSDGVHQGSALLKSAFAETGAEFVKHSEAAAQNLTQAVSQSAEKLSTGVNAAAETAAKGITEASSKMSDAVVDSSSELQNAISTSSEEFINNSQRVNASLRNTSDVISDNSEKTRKMFDEALIEMNSVLRTLVADLKDDSNKMSESYKAASQSLVTETDSMRSKFEQGMDAMRQQLGAELKNLVDQQVQENHRVLSGMSQHADRALKDTGEAVQKQVKMLDDALGHELNKVMSEMGRALVTISGKFTSDYQQLVNEMHNITRMRGDS
jgi:gas vesicle protein